MTNIKEIIILTLNNLNKNNIIVTPSNFEKEFYSLLKLSDLILEEYVELEDILNSLSIEEKKSINTTNLITFRELAHLLNRRISEIQIKKFLKDLLYLTSPSINSDIKNEFDELFKEITLKPNSLIDTQTIRKLRELTKKRIASDKSLFKEKTQDVKKLITFLGDQFNKSLNQNSITIKELSNIKSDIRNLKLSTSSEKELLNLQKKLINITDSFEKTVRLNNSNMINDQNKNDYLFKQIEELQHNLDKAEKEKSIDYLTGLLTRRAYEIELKRVEDHFHIFDSDYVIIFYDIDNFKMINDKYGHKLGDQVLSSFASILNKLTRKDDVIARYGGEEFISLIQYKSNLEIENYLKRVKNIIRNNKFVCDGIKIKIEFSAGVSFRKNYTSYEDAIKKADDLLYKAKNDGKDKIILDSGVVFK